MGKIIELLIYLSIVFIFYIIYKYTPQYNPKSKEIKNCKEGGIIWLHEFGHKVFINKYKSQNAIIWSIVMWTAISGMTFGFVYNMPVLFLLSLLTFIGWIVFDELYAWVYAIRNFKWH